VGRDALEWFHNPYTQQLIQTIEARIEVIHPKRAISAQDWVDVLLARGASDEAKNILLAIKGALKGDL